MTSLLSPISTPLNCTTSDGPNHCGPVWFGVVTIAAGSHVNEAGSPVEYLEVTKAKARPWKNRSEKIFE